MTEQWKKKEKTYHSLYLKYGPKKNWPATVKKNFDRGEIEKIVRHGKRKRGKRTEAIFNILQAMDIEFQVMERGKVIFRGDDMQSCFRYIILFLLRKMKEAGVDFFKEEEDEIHQESNRSGMHD